MKDAAGALRRFAEGWDAGDVAVHKARVVADEGQDGEQVTRLLLLLRDPSSDTWDVDEVQHMRHALARKAVELGLPPISLTLIPESESTLLESTS